MFLIRHISLLFTYEETKTMHANRNSILNGLHAVQVQAEKATDYILIYIKT